MSSFSDRNGAIHLFRDRVPDGTVGSVAKS